MNFLFRVLDSRPEVVLKIRQGSLHCATIMLLLQYAIAVVHAQSASRVLTQGVMRDRRTVDAHVHLRVAHIAAHRAACISSQAKNMMRGECAAERQDCSGKTRTRVAPAAYHAL